MNWVGDISSPFMRAARLPAPDLRLQAVIPKAPRHQYGGEVTTQWTDSAAIPASPSKTCPVMIRTVML